MNVATERPDIVLLAPDWRSRALLRAQLIEEGLAVVATHSWPQMRPLLRPHLRPLVAFVDLRGLPHPKEVLDDLTAVMKPHRAVVLTAIGTVDASDLRARGLCVVSRPTPIGRIVAALKNAVEGERRSGKVKPQRPSA